MLREIASEVSDSPVLAFGKCHEGVCCNARHGEAVMGFRAAFLDL